MNQLLVLLAILLVYGGPVAIGAWIGSRVRQGWLAFLTGWAATPIVGFIGAFIAESISYAADPQRSGGGLLVLVLPLICLFTGLLAGIVALVIVSVRNQKQATTPPEAHEQSAP